MPATTAAAPGKVIMLGEHAVVYGQPAIAVPVAEVSAQARIQPAIGAPSGQVSIQAAATNLAALLDDLPADEPIAAAIRLTLHKLGIQQPPAFKLRVESSIPMAAGLGSGAAVSVAVIRAVSGFLGHPLPDADVSAIAFEIEKLHHGTPSGIDNTVVTYALPVYFVKEQPIETIKVRTPFTLIIADTGVPSPTKIAVGDLHTAWQADPTRHEELFAAVGAISREARAAIKAGDVAALGPLMDANHAHLQQMGVSSPELDRLVEAARAAGALGAKLSGGGRGGNLIALAPEDRTQEIEAALRKSGAVSTIATVVQ
jgi:mevalonate kinase